jgi:hypothetical protein
MNILENELPYRESKWQYITRKYGNCYNIRKWEYRTPSEKSIDPWYLAKRIIANNIGKSFDLAFHYFCTKVRFQDQKYFFRHFETLGSFRWRHYRSYYIDDLGLIQENKVERKKRPITILTVDRQWVYTFDSKKDPLYKRVFAEIQIVLKAHKKYWKDFYKNMPVSRISDEEIKLKLQNRQFPKYHGRKYRLSHPEEFI